MKGERKGFASLSRDKKTVEKKISTDANAYSETMLTQSTHCR